MDSWTNELNVAGRTEQLVVVDEEPGHVLTDDLEPGSALLVELATQPR